MLAVVPIVSPGVTPAAAAAVFSSWASSARIFALLAAMAELPGLGWAARAIAAAAAR